MARFKKTYKKKVFKRSGNRKNITKKRLAGHRPSMIDRIARFGGAIGSVARTVAGMTRLINSEVKYLDVASSTTVTDVGATYLVLLNGLAQGDDYNNRSGRSVLMKSLTMKWQINNGTPASAQTVHFAIVMDKKPDSAVTNSHDAVYGASSTIVSQIDKATEGDRFVILRTMSVIVDSGTGLSKTGTVHIDLSGIHQLFDGTANTYASIEKNAIAVVAVSNQATSGYPALVFSSRYRFYDN